MTREEARHWLEIELKTWEDECKSKHPIKEALSVAIEALEQEAFINKPCCISGEVCEHDKNVVLDKIRAEIEQTSETIDGFLMHDGTKKTVLKIIDKYKADRSVKE